MDATVGSRDIWTTDLVVSVSCSVVPDCLWPHGPQPTRLFCPWDFPGRDTGVGCHFLLQGNFLTQGSNPGFLHCRQILYHLSSERSQTRVKNDTCTSAHPSQLLILLLRQLNTSASNRLSLWTFPLGVLTHFTLLFIQQLSVACLLWARSMMGAGITHWGKNGH